eukprot:255004-Alexandrium_andersonii.AAC.1
MRAALPWVGRGSSGLGCRDRSGAGLDSAAPTRAREKRGECACRRGTQFWLRVPLCSHPRGSVH